MIGEPIDVGGRGEGAADDHGHDGDGENEGLPPKAATLALRYFRCRHELLAVGPPWGYYKATGRSRTICHRALTGIGAECQPESATRRAG